MIIEWNMMIILYFVFIRVVFTKHLLRRVGFRTHKEFGVVVKTIKEVNIIVIMIIIITIVDFKRIVDLDVELESDYLQSKRRILNQVEKHKNKLLVYLSINYLFVQTNLYQFQNHNLLLDLLLILMLLQ